jgi:hypothetical protein
LQVAQQHQDASRRTEKGCGEEAGSAKAHFVGMYLSPARRAASASRRLHPALVPGGSRDQATRRLSRGRSGSGASGRLD